MNQTPAPDVGYHRGYFIGKGRTSRIALGVTPCVRRHVSQTIDPLNLAPGARVLELGCGLGRFTEVLLNRGYRVTALDLSDYLIGRLRDSLGSSNRLDTVVGRAEDVARLATGPFDAVVGFFFLHHLDPINPVLEAIGHVLADGGQIAFCEPNAFNPLVYLQVTFTPGMRWKGEPSIPKMRPGVLVPVLQHLGFTDIHTSLHGQLPPFVSNTALGGHLERRLEAIAPLRPLSAYRVFRARWRRR